MILIGQVEFSKVQLMTSDLQIRVNGLECLHVSGQPSPDQKSEHLLTINTRHLLYNTLVLTHLDYCSTVYHSCNIPARNKLEHVQSYGMRIILKRQPRTNSESLRNSLDWITLHQRKQNSMLWPCSTLPKVQVYQVINANVGLSLIHI